MTIEIGQKAPDLELKGDHGETVKLSDYKGKYIVLYFYPKDMTPGCTTEACDFRDSHESFAELDAVIIGVSPDNGKNTENLKRSITFHFCFLLMTSISWRKHLMCGS